MRTDTVVPAAPESGSDSATRDGVGPEVVGRRVREERLRQSIGVRELARRVGVSASLISQVELGKASPSVGTLYAIVNELGLSLDELFFQVHGARQQDGGARQQDGGARRAAGDGEPATRQQAPRPWPGNQLEDAPPVQPPKVTPVVHHDEAKVIQLATGVRWERLTPETPQDVDFLEVTYGVGSESCPPDSLMRHSGHEYGHVLEGRLGVTVGFDTYELGPGDSVAFDSTMPHRLFTIGEQTVRAIWVVVGRRGDARLGRF